MVFSDAGATFYTDFRAGVRVSGLDRNEGGTAPAPGRATGLNNGVRLGRIGGIDRMERSRSNLCLFLSGGGRLNS